MIWKFFLRILFLFDAERVHEFSAQLLEFLGRFFPRTLRYLASARALGPESARDQPLRVAGLEFWGPLGLAAGFDKNGRMLGALSQMGFSFVEVGTVTPRAQPGNEKPRLFRIPEEEALFNRMGFNNEGSDALKSRLREFQKRKPWNFRVGINLGKNKDTPPEMAVNDYVLLAEDLAEYADYLVINVSSPNTPGLRNLQSIESLEQLLRATRGAIVRSGFSRPLFLKLAPELEPDFVQEVAEKLPSWGGSGLILTNTLASQFKNLSGGLSGGPLKIRSREILKALRRVSDIPVISVGGIDSLAEANKRLDLGANLIQIYSAWIYRGPRFPASIAAGLRRKP